MEATVPLPVLVPDVRAFRCTNDGLRACIKEHFVIGRTERGKSEWWARGKVWRSGPGSIQVKEPGDVHRDIARDGPTTFTVIVLPTSEITDLRAAGKVVGLPHLEPSDARAQPFHRLHDAVVGGADRLSVEVAVAEAVATFASLQDERSAHSRPVRRAVEYLRERLADPISLDDLAHHASLDKFHLCRAFRAQIGMPPHAYLTHLRVIRAKALLKQGVRATDVAPRVGLYDQSQLNRHFRRIVGTTPARYGIEKQSEGARGLGSVLSR
ncbi:MAG: AraC family transcriptional regulator [Polyangiaceae bacterium]